MTARLPRSGTNPSARELEVLAHAAEGLTAAETGAALGLVEETVKTYRQKLLVRIGAKNMTQAVAIGLRQGLIA